MAESDLEPHVYYLSYRAAVTRLVVSAQGIAYRGVGGTLTATWDQVDSIAKESVPGRFTYHSVLILANSNQKIRLSQFGTSWRTDALGLDLQAYAPQLFQSE